LPINADWQRRVLGEGSLRLMCESCARRAALADKLVDWRMDSAWWVALVNRNADTVIQSDDNSGAGAIWG
jgi:hypothetical protein